MKQSIDAREQRDFFGAVHVIPCTRCGQPCRVAATSTPDARLLKHATTPAPGGLCVNCAVTQFIQGVEALRYGIQRNGLGMLRDPRIQAGFAQLLPAGNADARPDEIDWERVIEQWDIPFPKAPRRNRRQP